MRSEQAVTGILAVEDPGVEAAERGYYRLHPGHQRQALPPILHQRPR